jgi:hypothetical protein
MNDRKFELLKATKDELTIEDAVWLYEHGITTLCEDGKVVGFEFEYDLAI